MRWAFLLGLAATLAACNGGSHAAALTTTGARYAGHAAHCPRPRSYTPVLSAKRGGPGMLLHLAGTLPLYNESGHLDLENPTREFQVWWNLDFARWWSAIGRDPHPRAAGRGPVSRLLRVAIPVPNPCTYRLAVVIPHVQPGTYGLTILYGNGDSFAGMQPVRFTVTR